jgi:hypothetical protein
MLSILPAWGENVAERPDEGAFRQHLRFLRHILSHVLVKLPFMHHPNA